jgi:hypothetical protein
VITKRASLIAQAIAPGASLQSLRASAASRASSQSLPTRLEHHHTNRSWQASSITPIAFGTLRSSYLSFLTTLYIIIMPQVRGWPQSIHIHHNCHKSAVPRYGATHAPAQRVETSPPHSALTSSPVIPRLVHATSHCNNK